MGVPRCCSLCATFLARAIAAASKYLDEVLPVMSLQDERLKEKMAVADTEQAQKLVVVMMNRTKERLKVEALRDIATEL